MGHCTAMEKTRQGSKDVKSSVWAVKGKVVCRAGPTQVDTTGNRGGK